MTAPPTVRDLDPDLTAARAFVAAAWGQSWSPEQFDDALTAAFAAVRAEEREAIAVWLDRRSRHADANGVRKGAHR